MFIVSKYLLISSATVIVRPGGAIWLNHFATVVFIVCSAISCPLWSSVYECQREECAFTSPVRT